MYKCFVYLSLHYSFFLDFCFLYAPAYQEAHLLTLTVRYAAGAFGDYRRILEHTFQKPPLRRQGARLVAGYVKF